MVDLAPLLKQTRALWQKNLAGMHARAQYILGEQCRRFEREFADFLNCRAAIGCGNGTQALELCLRSAEVTSPRQEVIVPAMTSPFTALAVCAAGARPVFADVDAQTLLLDPDSAAGCLTKNTAAVIPVHLYGNPCDLPALRTLARKTGSALIQDACQAHGALCNGFPLTHFSPYVAYSFYPTKNLGCLGDGGAVATSRIHIEKNLRLLRDGGRSGGQVSRSIAINSRLDEMQACYLSAFLTKLGVWNTKRSRLAHDYNQSLQVCSDIQLVNHLAGSAHHLYVIRAPRREKLRAYLSRHGVQTAVHYPVPLHLHPAFRAFTAGKGSCPNAERAAKQILSLPLHPSLRKQDVLRIADLVKKFYH